MPDSQTPIQDGPVTDPPAASTSAQQTNQVLSTAREDDDLSGMFRRAAENIARESSLLQGSGTLEWQAQVDRALFRRHVQSNTLIPLAPSAEIQCPQWVYMPQNSQVAWTFTRPPLTSSSMRQTERELENMARAIQSAVPIIPDEIIRAVATQEDLSSAQATAVDAARGIIRRRLGPALRTSPPWINPFPLLEAVGGEDLAEAAAVFIEFSANIAEFYNDSMRRKDYVSFVELCGPRATAAQTERSTAEMAAHGLLPPANVRDAMVLTTLRDMAASFADIMHMTQQESLNLSTEDGSNRWKRTYTTIWIRSIVEMAVYVSPMPGSANPFGGVAARRHLVAFAHLPDDLKLEQKDVIDQLTKSAFSYGRDLNPPPSVAETVSAISAQYSRSYLTSEQVASELAESAASAWIRSMLIYSWAMAQHGHAVRIDLE